VVLVNASSTRYTRPMLTTWGRCWPLLEAKTCVLRTTIPSQRPQVAWPNLATKNLYQF
jgi:hypothetical protein